MTAEEMYKELDAALCRDEMLEVPDDEFDKEHPSNWLYKIKSAFTVTDYDAVLDALGVELD